MELTAIDVIFKMIILIVYKILPKYFVVSYRKVYS